MRKLICFFVIGLVISSCSRQVYIYKTENFNLPQSSRIYISENDSIKCLNIYSPTFDLRYLDSISINFDLREVHIKENLSENLNKHGFYISEQSELSDFIINYQDYWFCNRKKNLVSLYIKLTNLQDSSNQALIVNKAFDVTAKLDLNKEMSKSIDKLVQENKHSFSIKADELCKFPKINDVPLFPSKQLGLSYGYSLGMLPHSELYDKYENYYDGINVHYGGIDLDFYRKKNSGLGIKSIYYFGSNNQQNVEQLDDNNNVIGNGKLSDDINFFFIGPSLNLRIPFFSYNLLDIVKISSGYLNYTNHAIRFDDKFNYKGQTIAWIISAGLDIKLNSHMNIGIEPKFLFAGFKKMEINGTKMTLEKKEKLNRVEIAIILKLN